MRYHRVPDETIRRLPNYLREVQLLSEKGRKQVSSSHLAESLGLNSAQIRKDFSYFGDFGIPGVGYDTTKLQKHVRKILKLNSVHNTVLVGVGNLGSAVLAYGGFEKYGFKIGAAFDNDPKKIGKKRSGVVIEDISKLNIKGHKIDIGIVTVPSESAQDIADVLVRAGVRGILNFSPQHLVVPKKVKVISIDIAMDLARLPYYMAG